MIHLRLWQTDRHSLLLFRMFDDVFHLFSILDETKKKKKKKTSSYRPQVDVLTHERCGLLRQSAANTVAGPNSRPTVMIYEFNPPAFPFISCFITYFYVSTDFIDLIGLLRWVNSLESCVFFSIKWWNNIAINSRIIIHLKGFFYWFN